MLRIVKERCAKAELPETICNHTFRGTGITVFLQNGGSLEAAQDMANHTDPRTTKLYDRRKDLATLSEIERGSPLSRGKRPLPTESFSSANNLVTPSKLISGLRPSETMNSRRRFPFRARRRRFSAPSAKTVKQSRWVKAIATVGV